MTSKETKKTKSVHAAKPATTPETAQPSTIDAKEATTMTTATNNAPAAQTLDPTAVNLPPPGLAFPKPPDGAVIVSGRVFAGLRLRTTEVAAMPRALTDLTAFTNYAAVLGQTAPPQAHLTAAIQAGHAWSNASAASAAWDAYCKSELGLASTDLRALMVQLVPSWDLAVSRDPSLATKYAGLAALLGAKKAIAKKGAATKAANKKEVEAGGSPTHGAVGKRRKKKAANAALAAAEEKAASPPPATQSETAAAPPPAANPVATASSGTPPHA